MLNTEKFGAYRLRLCYSPNIPYLFYDRQAPPSSVHILLTGGTFDSEYDGQTDTVKPLKSSMVPNYLRKLNLYGKTECTELFMKDSRSITLDDLRLILTTIEKSKHSKFLIVHGTYTMPDTARFLKKNLKRRDTTIILTGSMIPHNFLNSDASFNLGFAYATVLHQKPGISIAMNGKLFDAEEVAKNLAAGKFVSLFNK